MSKPSLQRTRSRVGPWSAGPSMGVDARTLLQRRVALFFLIQLVLSGASLVLGLARDTLEHGSPLAGGLLGRGMDRLYANVVVVLLFGALWSYGRRADRPERVLYALESGATVLVCVASGLSLRSPGAVKLIAQGSVLHWKMFLIVVIVLVARAALVPSSAARSLLIGLASLLPITVATHWAVASGRQLSVWSFPSETAWIVAVWGVSFVVVTAVTSRTIYGLQTRIREVMQLGQYVLEEKLGEGGMGVVYRARHALMRRPTAVKLLLPDQAGADGVARFEREVQLSAQLTHPNTITIFDYGRTADGVFYYAMELLQGASLQAVVDGGGPQPAARVLRVLRMVAAALTEAHERGLIHRDIKPANILLCEQGGELDVAKVLDFGLVKRLDQPPEAGLTQEGRVFGTPQYVAPETMRTPDQVDGRADLYALGAVGYYMLTGQTVFEGETSLEVCLHHLRTLPIPPSERSGAPVPADLEAIIMDCLEKDPADRPPSARELGCRLAACQGADTWGFQQARAWWDEHGEAIDPIRAATASTGLTATVAVDLAHRDEPQVA